MVGSKVYPGEKWAHSLYKSYYGSHASMHHASNDPTLRVRSPGIENADLAG